MKTIILVSGKIHNGKNQLADYLKTDLINANKVVLTDLFAKTLKDWCKEDFKPLTYVLANIREEIKSIATIMFDNPCQFIDRNVEHMLGAINKSLEKLTIIDDNFYENKTDITRTLLQIFGTNIFRNRVDNDWWAKQLANRCLESKAEFIIITDVRFPNEIEVFNQYISNEFNVVSIRVERNVINNALMANHESETALDNWDSWTYKVDNNGSLDDLRHSSKTIVNDILNPIHDDSELNVLELATKQ